MKTSLFLAAILTFVAAHLHAQQRDSLLAALKTSREDTGCIHILLHLQATYLDDDNDSALFYNTLALKLIDKLHAEQYRHRCYHEFVKIYHAEFNYQTAFDYCVRSIDIAKRDKDSFEMATSYRALFSLYYNLGEEDSAIKYGIYALQLTERIGDTANIAVNYANLCRIYKGLYQYDRAIEYGKKGVEMGERYSDTKNMLVSMNNLGNCYMETGRYNEAIELFKRQKVIGEKIKRKRSVELAMFNLGMAYFDLGDAKNMKEIADEVRAYEQKFDSNDVSNQSNIHLTYGYDYILQKQYEAAEKELLTALSLAEKDSLSSAVETAYVVLSNIKFAQQDFARGNYYQILSDSVNNSIRRADLSEYGAGLEKKYETEKKEAKIQQQKTELQQKNIINSFLIGAAVLLIAVLLLGYRNYKNKQILQQQRISELETEKQLTATEAVLKGEEQERTRLAKDLHDGLGGMLSGIKYSLSNMKGNLVMTPDNAHAFERSIDMLDSSIQEMRRVAHNMMPEALLKFGLDAALEDFCNDINQTGVLQVHYQSLGFEHTTLSQTTAITFYRIVQELVNNTIKHAQATSLIVQLSKTNSIISITVEDDGKGFDTSILKGTKGIGWRNIQNRVEYVKGSMDVQSEEGKGTSVHIEMPSEQ